MDFTENQKLLVGSIEAAKLLDISPRTLWTLRNAGAVPFVRIGASVKYSVSALQTWIESQQIYHDDAEGSKRG